MSRSSTDMLGTAGLVYRDAPKPRSDSWTKPHPQAPSQMMGTSPCFECHVCYTKFVRGDDLNRHISDCHVEVCRGFSLSSSINKSKPSQQDLPRRKPVIPAIAVSSDTAQDESAASSPPLFEADFTALRPVDHSVTIEAEQKQPTGNFKHRYDSTSSRKSGKSDEGYHSLYGDPDTSRETLLADRPPSSYRSDTLGSIILEDETDVPVPHPEPVRLSIGQRQRHQCPTCIEPRVYSRLHSLEQHIKFYHSEKSRDKNSPRVALSDLTTGTAHDRPTQPPGPTNSLSIRTSQSSSTRQPRKSRRALPGDLFFQNSQQTNFDGNEQQPQPQPETTFVQIVYSTDWSQPQNHTLKRNHKSNNLRHFANTPTVNTEQISPPKPASESPTSVEGLHQELPSPVTSKSTQKHSNHSESELSFIGGGTSLSLDINSVTESDRETQFFINRLANRIVHRYLGSLNATKFRSHATWQDGSNSSTIPSHSGGTPPTSISTSSKRARQNEDNEDDSQDGQKDRAPDSKRKRGNADVTTKLFACPYAKFDPERYSERNHSEKRYRKCASKYLNSITRVKQHLYRTHARPSWYCGNCYESFNSRESLNEHNRRRPPCESQPSMYEEMMTDDQFQGIKRRSVGNSAYESWYKIFQILFPAAPKPLSPYVSTCDPATVAHFVAFFRRCGPQELLNLMRDQVDQNGDRAIQLAAPTQAIVDEAFEIALPECLAMLDRNRPAQQRIESDNILVNDQAESGTLPHLAIHTRRQSQILDFNEQNSRLLSEEDMEHEAGPSQSPHASFQNLHHGYDHDHNGDEHRSGWNGQDTTFLHGALQAMNGPFNDPSHSFVMEEPLLDPSQVEGAFDAYELPAMDGTNPNALTGVWTGSNPSSSSLDPRADVADANLLGQWQYLGQSHAA